MTGQLLQLQSIIPAVWCNPSPFFSSHVFVEFLLAIDKNIEAININVPKIQWM